MAFQRPLLTDLVTRIEADLVSRLGLVGAVLRKSVVYVLARVFAGVAHMLHGHLQYISRQSFADQSDREFLIRDGSLYGIDPLAALFASGNVVFTGNSGITVPAETAVQRADGTQYSTQVDVTLAAGTGTVAVQAVLAGAAGNAPAATAVSLVSPIGGVNAQAAADGGGFSGGTDEESTEAYRARVLLRKRSGPVTGKPGDYVQWALAAGAFVTRAWEYDEELGPGTVTVRFAADSDVGGPIPTGGEVTTVQTYIDGQRPVCAHVTVVAPISDAIDFTLHIVPVGGVSLATAKAAVQAALAALFLAEASPGGTVWDPDTGGTKTGGVLLLAHIEQAIAEADGVSDWSLTSPNANVVSAAGHLSVLGTFTWT